MVQKYDRLYSLDVVKRIEVYIKILNLSWLKDLTNSLIDLPSYTVTSFKNCKK